MSVAEEVSGFVTQNGIALWQNLRCKHDFGIADHLARKSLVWFTESETKH